MEASILYLDASNKAHNLGYNGCAKYFLEMSKEESHHARKVVKFINKRGRILEQPEIKFTIEGEELADIFSNIMDLEIEVMANLVALSKTSIDSGDEAAESFLDEMIKEQIDGVDEATINYKKCLIAKENGDLLGFDEYIKQLA
ncbi:MAG: hypothetical protein HQK96_04360 [Nitrospirae bacterium]|nr:hypothetical protein [Nitrospirota bacterium]